jgi:hypothetical protein
MQHMIYRLYLMMFDCMSQNPSLFTLIPFTVVNPKMLRETLMKATGLGVSLR